MSNRKKPSQISFDETSQLISTEHVQKLTELVKEQKEEFTKYKDEQKAEFEKYRQEQNIKTIEVLGIFTAILAYLTISANVVINAKTIEEKAILLVVFGLAIIGFVYLLNYIRPKYEHKVGVLVIPNLENTKVLNNTNLEKPVAQVQSSNNPNFIQRNYKYLAITYVICFLLVLFIIPNFAIYGIKFTKDSLLWGLGFSATAMLWLKGEKKVVGNLLLLTFILFMSLYSGAVQLPDSLCMNAPSDCWVSLRSGQATIAALVSGILLALFGKFNLTSISGEDKKP